jgi:hypothetical protein
MLVVGWMAVAVVAGKILWESIGFCWLSFKVIMSACTFCNHFMTNSEISYTEAQSNLAVLLDRVADDKDIIIHFFLNMDSYHILLLNNFFLDICESRCRDCYR